MKKSIKFFLLGLVLGVFCTLGPNLIGKKLEDFFYAQIGKPYENIILVKFPRKSPPEIDAKAVISVKVFPSGKEKVLFRKNAKEVLPIASLTKLMTAVVSLENYDIYDKVIISKKAQDQIDVPNYGNLKEGEVFTQITLLKLMLIYSSNDAAFALAEKMGVKDFVKKMNQKAKEIGMENTIFFTPTGLKNKGLNVSSVEDLLRLVKYILKEKPMILEFSKQKLKFNPPHSIFEITLPGGKKLVGGKTGFLPAEEVKKEQDWGCMIYVFEDEKGIIFINIILGAKSAKERVIQMQKLINWIYS
jgi:D-alanyl-D-alanine carboxypeptidase (penicillin-binding protein 5/6)